MAKSVGDYFRSSHLKAGDVEKAKLLTIASWSEDEMPDGGVKPVLAFQEVDQTLVLNRTNAETIAEFLGTGVFDKWVGKKIVLFKDRTMFGNQRVDCIRVREPKVQPKGPSESDKFEKAMEAATEEAGDDYPF